MIKYLNYQWVETDEDSDALTIGLTEDGIDQIEDIKQVLMPELEEIVSANSICMEIRTSTESFNIYSPVDGQISEVNVAVSEEPNLIQQDNYGDGWLIKIEPDEPVDTEELESISQEEL